MACHIHHTRTHAHTHTNPQINFSSPRPAVAVAHMSCSPFRIVYASAPGPPHNKAEDTTLEFIEKHLKQLQPVFEQYKNDIYAFQAGIIGHWGEWHHSVYGLDSDENKIKVTDLLHKYLPTSPCLKIQVRTPMDAAILAPQAPQNDQEAFGDQSTCTRAKRIGLHNDCWMSGADDYSTYIPPPSSGVARGIAARKYWLDSTFVSHITRYSGFGGETCVTADGGNVWSGLSCASLFAEATQLHAAFLNPTWHPKVTHSQSYRSSKYHHTLSPNFKLIRLCSPPYFDPDLSFLLVQPCTRHANSCVGDCVSEGVVLLVAFPGSLGVSLRGKHLRRHQHQHHVQRRHRASLSNCVSYPCPLVVMMASSRFKVTLNLNRLWVPTTVTGDKT